MPAFDLACGICMTASGANAHAGGTDLYVLTSPKSSDVLLPDTGDIVPAPSAYANSGRRQAGLH